MQGALVGWRIRGPRASQLIGSAAWALVTTGSTLAVGLPLDHGCLLNGDKRGAEWVIARVKIREAEVCGTVWTTTVLTPRHGAVLSRNPEGRLVAPRVVRLNANGTIGRVAEVLTTAEELRAAGK